MSLSPLWSGMGRDRSLEEFVGGGSDGSSAAPDADPATDGDTDDTPEGADGTAPDAERGSDADSDTDPAAATDDGVEPAAVTYRWDPDGVRCADCGATVERLWSGEAGPVCGECKAW